MFLPQSLAYVKFYRWKAITFEGREMISLLLLQHNVRAEFNPCDLIGYRQMRVDIVGSTVWAVGVGLLGPRLAGRDLPVSLNYVFYKDVVDTYYVIQFFFQ